jgi:hypothetical protein
VLNNVHKKKKQKNPLEQKISKNYHFKGVVRPSSRPPTLSLRISLAQFDFNFYKKHLEDFSLQEQPCW